MSDVLFYLSQPFAQHAVLATVLVAILCGIIGPFVIMRGMAFAVHGTSELAFTGAAAGLLSGIGALAGAFFGSLIVAILIAGLSVRERQRDAGIGVVLAFGLGLGVLLLSFYHGFATAATNILFGDIFGVSGGQIWLLLGVGALVCTAMWIMYRPLLFASLDPTVASARGVPVRALDFAFLIMLALTITEAAQIVGTLLVLSLAITPAAAAVRVSARPHIIVGLSILFAIIAGVGGLLLSFAFNDIKPSVFITFISFAIYAVIRLVWSSSKTTSKSLHHQPQP